MIEGSPLPPVRRRYRRPTRGTRPSPVVPSQGPWLMPRLVSNRVTSFSTREWLDMDPFGGPGVFTLIDQMLPSSPWDSLSIKPTPNPRLRSNVAPPPPPPPPGTLYQSNLPPAPDSDQMLPPRDSLSIKPTPSPRLNVTSCSPPPTLHFT